MQYFLHGVRTIRKNIDKGYGIYVKKVTWGKEYM